MYHGASLFQYKPLLLPGSAHAVVIRASMLFDVQFSVILKISLFQLLKMFELTTGIFPQFMVYVSQYIHLQIIYFSTNHSKNRP